MARSPFQRGIEVRHVNDDEAAEEFLRLGIRAIMNLPLPVVHGYHRRRVGRLQARGRDNDACGAERFAVSLTGCDHSAVAAVELFLWLENK